MDHSWIFYEKVNEAYADRIISSYKHGDTIWVHDYHLLLVPLLVRKKIQDAKIGFFLHTPCECHLIEASRTIAYSSSSSKPMAQFLNQCTC